MIPVIVIKQLFAWKDMSDKNMEFVSCLSAASLSRYKLINETTHKETCGYSLNPIGCWWEFEHEISNNFDV